MQVAAQRGVGAARLCHLQIPAAVTQASRTFFSTPVAAGFGSHVSDNDPKVLEKEKQKNLKGEAVETNPQYPGWNEKLASDSEAVVKAEKTDMGVKEMQEATENVAEETHENDDPPRSKAGDSSRDAGSKQG